MASLIALYNSYKFFELGVQGNLRKQKRENKLELNLKDLRKKRFLHYELLRRKK